jgi:glucan phosphoethanolaminetransferase (alkaline phosphatase superfamily)
MNLKHTINSLSGLLPQRWYLLALLFFVLFFLFLSIDLFDFTHFYIYLFRVKGFFKFIASLFLYAGLVTSMVLLITSKNIVIKVIAYVILAATFSTELSYRLINGYGFTFNEASIALSEWGFAGNAFRTFFPVIWFVPLVTLFIAMTIFVVTQKYYPKTPAKISLPVTGFFLVLGYFVLHQTSGEQSYPSMFKIPLLTVFAVQHPLYTGDRESVKLQPGDTTTYKHIIYITDESVRGDFLSINNRKIDVTPFLVSISGNIVNYGIASSGGNTSSNSQLILRTGAGVNSFPDREQVLFTEPDIFQYAKKAGYETNLLDGQKDVLQNFMRHADLKSIDHFRGIKEKGMDGDRIDYLLAYYIYEILNNSQGKTFTYVVKMGAHFHYEDYYPEAQKIFRPTLEIGELNRDQEKMVNSYMNVTRWNVDGFFRHLLLLLKDRTDYVIIYTSDHGQTLLDDGIVSTHSDLVNAHPYQACVPFFIYFPDSLQKASFNYRKENVDHVSHFNIFPSVLIMMGYDTSDVENLYDPTIFEPLGEPRYFFTGSLFLPGTFNKTAFDSPKMAGRMKEISQ